MTRNWLVRNFGAALLHIGVKDILGKKLLAEYNYSLIC